MRGLTAALLAAAVIALPMELPAADGGKSLQNIRGTVDYQTGGATHPLAPKAEIALSDSDSAQTGANSQAAISLPDSSRVLLGEDTNVQLKSFNQTDVANANFVVVGKVRFQVRHPAGAKANYTFSTGTGQIAVRGTTGDINTGPQGLQVNVYEVSNPSLPVQVTLTDGRVFVLHAGQSLVVNTVAGGSLSAAVGHVSQQLFKPFSSFGAPPNAGALGLSTGAAAAGAVPVAAAAGAAAAAAGIAAADNSAGNTTPSATPSPAPSSSGSPSPLPTATGTAVPINISSDKKATPVPAPAVTPHPPLPPNLPGLPRHPGRPGQPPGPPVPNQAPGGPPN